MTKSGKHFGKRRNCLFWAISSFVTMFSKSCLLQRRLFTERVNQNQTLAIFIDNKPPLKQTYFDSSVADNIWKQCAKDKIAHNEQFLLLSQCFILYSIIILRLIQIFVQIFSMSSVVVWICCMWERDNVTC